MMKTYETYAPHIQALWDEFPFFIGVYRQDFKIIWANRIAWKNAADTGERASCEMDRGKKYCYQLWGASAPCTGCPLEDALRTGDAADMALPEGGEWPSGKRVRQVRLLPVASRDHGQLLVETACDITRTQDREAALDMLQSRLRDAQRLARIGHWELLPQTGELFWSEEIFRIFEIDPLAFGASYEAFLNATHPEDRERVHTAYTQSLKSRSPYKIEHRLLMNDGRIKYVQERCKTEYNDEGIPVKSIGTVQDITENKRIEDENKSLQEKIVHVQKMESVGRLAGGVAHDFNNMLFVILGNLDLVMTGMDEEDEDFHALSEIRNAARRSAELTRQLLAFARQQPISPRPLDLNDTIANMIKMLTRLIGEDIELKWIPGENLGRVLMDPTQVDQILVNLCVNARDAISANGRITIETHMACVGESDCRQRPEFHPGEFVILEVSDNGCGMDKKVRERVFEPFFTTKKADKGTGLGLATTYGIVKQNKGFINVYSEPDNGTTFRLYFAAHQGDEKVYQTAPAAAKTVKGKGETILLVEDEAMILNFCAKTLENLGYRVLKAGSPHQALSIAGRNGGNIDLLLTDVIMAQMSGKDLSQTLLKDFSDLKTLYMSGYTANVIARHGILEEGIMFLQKPFSTDALAVKVREALASVN
ncbi:MAG: ATP-binding protein [Desulfobacterales bacterium]|nr:ATP-binding protein [Desulfobacterales bacterium]